MFASVSHMWMASLETGLIVVAGLSAWKMLRRQQAEFFARSFKLALVLLMVVAPLQMWLGDASGRTVFEHQPAKGAAIEGLWKSNEPGTGASWSLLAWPNQDEQRNDWSFEIPGALSLLATHTLTGRVQGLGDFAREDQPPMVPLLYYAFRVMAGIGAWFALLAAWTAWSWARARWRVKGLLDRTWLLRAWVLTIPLPYIAVEAGWTVREVGRQPWVIHGLLRTQDAVSQHPAGMVAGSLSIYLLFYAGLLVSFLVFARRWFRKGADLAETPPSDPTSVPLATEVQ
jgi:cytochrome d ubiquinol oxidase subunit I